MKDLDFDELDKAVNTLMAGVSKTPPSSEAGEKTLEVPSPATTQATPVNRTEEGTAPVSVASPSRPVVSKPAPFLARPTPVAKRGGRFMDVVPPAAVKKHEAEKTVSRSGVTIEPTKPSVANPVIPALSTSASLTPPEVESPSPAEEKTAGPSVQSDWPDPLEMANFTDKEKPDGAPVGNVTSSESAKSAIEPKAETETEDTDESTADSPLSTPFLLDTKVEKRPLGANAITSAKDDAAAEPSSALITEDLNDQLPATAEDVKSILPEELHSDLVAIESDMTEPEVVSKPLGEDKQPVEKEVKKEPLAQNSVSSEPVKEAPKESKGLSSSTMTATSISQQYREEPASGDQKSGAIYDTETYHKPLSHPAKQKSGWIWIVWILLILLVGAGGGAALYFLGILNFR